MKQVLVAACVGVLTGWVGFGWVLAEASLEVSEGYAQVATTPALQDNAEMVRLGGVMEPNQRG